MIGLPKELRLGLRWDILIGSTSLLSVAIYVTIYAKGYEVTIAFNVTEQEVVVLGFRYGGQNWQEELSDHRSYHCSWPST